MLIKILGAVDMIAAFVFLLFIFGFHPWIHLILFCAGLLFFKGLFVLTGDALSIIDLVSFVILTLSILFVMPAILYWILRKNQELM